MNKNWDEYFYNLCKTAASNSKCLSRQIGAIIVKDNTVLSIGYNGPPRGVPHCGERYSKDMNLIKRMENINEDIYIDICPRKALGFKSGEGLEFCCISGDSKIFLLNGNTKTIQELYEEKEFENWIYSTNTETLEIVPSKYTNIFFNGYRDQMIEISFDDKTSIKVTNDHLIMLRNGNYISADQLKEGDRIMSLYLTDWDGYDRITNQKTSRKGNTPSICIEDLVYNYFNEGVTFGSDFVIHHIDGNKKNNCPENLKYMSRKDHSSLHILNLPKEAFIKGGQNAILKRKENYEKFIQECSDAGRKSMKENWNNFNFRKKMEKMRFEISRKGSLVTNKNPESIKKRAKGRIFKKIIELVNLTNGDINNENYEEYIQKLSSKQLGKGFGFYQRKTVERYFTTLNEAIELAKNNHIITKIRVINEKTPVYDLHVPDFNNFAINLGNNSGVFVHNCAGHAERNTIVNAARHGISVKDSTLYCSCPIPCSPCLVEIINVGIKEIVVTDMSYYDMMGEWLVKESGIKVRKFEGENDAKGY